MDALYIQKSYRESVEGFAKYVDSGLYNSGQLCAIRYGLENGLNVTSYAKPENSAEDMHRCFKQLCMEKR